MPLKSITHKVVQVEKRRLENNRTNAFSTFALFAFWTAATTGALALAAFSFYIAEPRTDFASTTKVDPVTTAGISRSARPEGFSERRRRTQLANRNDKRLNDVTRVINRLRSEQTVLNERIAELDITLSKLRDENKALKSTVSALKNTAPKSGKPVIVPPRPKHNGSPESLTKLVPRSVDTKRVVNAPKVQLNKPRDASNNSSATGKSNHAKTTQTDNTDAIDGRTVGSIAIAETAKFGLDLGASSTGKRAKNLWNELGARRPEILGSLVAKYVETGVEEGQTRLVAGPFANAGDAIKACVALRKIDAFCKTTLFPQ